jgi:hypothetical protein
VYPNIYLLSTWNAIGHIEPKRRIEDLGVDHLIQVKDADWFALRDMSHFGIMLSVCSVIKEARGLTARITGV